MDQMCVKCGAETSARVPCGLSMCFECYVDQEPAPAAPAYDTVQRPIRGYVSLEPDGRLVLVRPGVLRRMDGI